LITEFLYMDGWFLEAGRPASGIMEIPGVGFSRRCFKHLYR